MLNADDALTQAPWTVVIRPHARWLDFRLRELWDYRDLVFLFVRRDFVAQYKQTVLGPMWHVINPIITTGVFALVFGKIAGLSTDGLPPFLFYLSGTVMWNYFSRCLNGTTTTFISNAGIFGKVYFPRLVAPTSVVISQLIAFGVQFSVFIAALVFYHLRGADVHLTSWVFIAPLLLFIMAALGLGVGILVSAITTRYRDLGQLVGYFVTMMMYFTPVVYPLSAVPPAYRWLTLANPVTPVVEAFRVAFLGRGLRDPLALAYSALIAVVFCVAGLLLFHRVERTFMDTV